MSLPVTRQGASAATNIPEGFSRSEGKTLMRMQNAEIAHGLVAATRVQAAAMVAQVANEEREVRCGGPVREAGG